jgi:hypothetical protein
MPPGSFSYVSKELLSIEYPLRSTGCGVDRDSKDADASCYSPDTSKPNDNSNVVMKPRLQRSGSFENVESKRGPRIEPPLEISVLS